MRASHKKMNTLYDTNNGLALIGHGPADNMKGQALIQV